MLISWALWLVSGLASMAIWIFIVKAPAWEPSPCKINTTQLCRASGQWPHPDPPKPHRRRRLPHFDDVTKSDAARAKSSDPKNYSTMVTATTSTSLHLSHTTVTTDNGPKNNTSFTKKILGGQASCDEVGRFFLIATNTVHFSPSSSSAANRTLTSEQTTKRRESFTRCKSKQPSEGTSRTTEVP